MTANALALTISALLAVQMANTQAQPVDAKVAPAYHADPDPDPDPAPPPTTPEPTPEPAADNVSRYVQPASAPQALSRTRGRALAAADGAQAPRYWADPINHAIKRTSADGSMEEVIVADVLSPYGIALDASANQLLWTSSTYAVVQKAGMQGGAAQDLVSSFEAPFAIQVGGDCTEPGLQCNGAYAYVVEGTRVARRRADADGDGDGAPEYDVIADLGPGHDIHGLALDTATGNLYIGNAIGGMSYRLHLDTGLLEQLQFVDVTPQIVTDDDAGPASAAFAVSGNPLVNPSYVQPVDPECPQPQISRQGVSALRYPDPDCDVPPPPPPPPPPGPVWGYADLHSHLMGEHMFGGSWFWGSADGNENHALHRCDGNHVLGGIPPYDFPIGPHLPGKGTHGTFDLPFINVNAPFLPEMLLGQFTDLGYHSRNGYDPRKCKYFRPFIFFGPKIEKPGTCPAANYSAWPRADGLAHQQMWRGWLQNAHAGGLQVMVVSLAESSLLCQATPALRRRYGCDEMASIKRQAGFAHQFVANNSAWVGIATTPQQARSLIAQGKLALILAVEVTKLFPDGDYAQQLDELRALGIRSVQVVHHADNRFGGAAPINMLITAAKVAKLAKPGLESDIDDIVCRNAAGAQDTCDGISYLNVRGLTQEGQGLVNAMMDRGMLLDVAHLSRKALRETAQLASQRAYPLLYSHTHMFDTVDSDEDRHEKYMTAEEIDLVRNSNGMIGLRTGPEDTNPYYGQFGSVSNSCQGTTRSFAQSLMYAVDKGVSVGFGVDMNGFIAQAKPRYRTSAASQCHDDLYQLAGHANEFDRKGLAHIGLLPLFFDDLRKIGVNNHYTDHLLHSAENLLQLWERSVAASGGIGTGSGNMAAEAVVTATSTYCEGECYSPSRVNDGDASTTLGPAHSWVNAHGQPMPQAVELTWPTIRNIGRVELYTTDTYPMSAYDIQYWNGSGWIAVANVDANTQAQRSHAFVPVSTSKLRILGRLGPTWQPGYVRVNEIRVFAQ